MNRKDNSNVDSIEEAVIIQDIFNIIKFHFNIEIDEESLNYSRFLTHLRYFLRRVNEDERYDSNETDLYRQVREKYETTYQCVVKITDYLKKKVNTEMTQEEQLYFILHINRLTNREKQTNKN